MIRIPICFLLILCVQAAAKPWYEFADEAVDQLIEERFKNVSDDRELLANKLFKYACDVEETIVPIIAENSKDKDSIEKSQNLLIALLIKGSDLNHKNSKIALINVLAKGAYGVDRDLAFAHHLRKEIIHNAPYIEAKPWYKFFEHADSQQFLKPMKDITCKTCEAEQLFNEATKLFSSIKTLSQISDINNVFIASVLRSSELGSNKAKMMMATFLRLGSMGLKRDLEFANQLETEVEIANLTGIMAEVIRKYPFIKHFSYDSGRQSLLVRYDRGCTLISGAEGERLYRLLNYTKQKDQDYTGIHNFFWQMGDYIKELEKVD